MTRLGKLRVASLTSNSERVRCSLIKEATSPSKAPCGINTCSDVNGVACKTTIVASGVDPLTKVGAISAEGNAKGGKREVFSQLNLIIASGLVDILGGFKNFRIIFDRNLFRIFKRDLQTIILELIFEKIARSWIISEKKGKLLF